MQLAYEYGYGFDGGRRWRKDTVNGVWTRYPCGVACGAGELVEQTSDLSGSQWTTSVLYLQGISLVRRNNEWHHFDPLGTAQVITNNSASVISNNLYDVFGVLRYEQGSAQTPWRYGRGGLSVGADASASLLLQASGVLYIAPTHQTSLQPWSSYDECMKRMSPILGKYAALFCLLFHWLFPVPNPPQAQPQPQPAPQPPPGVTPPVQPPVQNPCPKGMSWIQVNCVSGSIGRCIPDKEVEKWHACCRSDGTPYIGTDPKQCEPKPQNPVREPAH